MKKIILEIRLLLCAWGFTFILWVVPNNNSEGIIIVESVMQYASKILAMKKN